MSQLYKGFKQWDIKSGSSSMDTDASQEEEQGASLANAEEGTQMLYE